MQLASPGLRSSRAPAPWRTLAFFGIGFYGGFVQAGVGFLLLAGLVLGGGLNLVNGNTARVVIIATYTPVALFIFARAAQVDLAGGGGCSPGVSSSGHGPRPNWRTQRGPWVRWVLVVAAAAAAVRMVS